MIVDTSALVAIITGESDAELLLDKLSLADEVAVSAATLTEALIVLAARAGRDACADVRSLLADLRADVVPLDENQALRAAEAWERFGRGRHPAKLNLGDCYSYALAVSTGRPLLYKGNDFTQTDVTRA